MADDDMFMGLLKDLGSKIADEALSQIFGDPATLTLPDIKAAIAEEINKAFFQQGAEDELLNAAAILQDAQSYLAIDYQNAKDSGTSKTELWQKLDESTTTPHLSALNTEANKLEAWIDRAAGQEGGDKVAATASTIYLGLHLHICLYHHERSLVAPDDQVAAELNDMRDKARNAIKVMMPHVLGLIDSRLSCLTYQENAFGADPNSNSTIVGDTMKDNWFAGGGVYYLNAWGPSGGRASDFRFPLRAVLHCTTRLLWSGGQAEADALWRALEHPSLGPPPMENHDGRNDYRGLTYTADLDFGKWASNARNLLMQLDIVATGIGSTEQEQWGHCNLCGVLYYTNGTTRCPGESPFGPFHQNPGSFNYVMRCDSPSPPSHTQPDWRWCANCGALHLPESGTSVCPNGGAHVSDGSANYLLPMVPPAPPVGIASVQAGWSRCKSCSALHFGGGTSVCPATGGPHETVDGGNYQLTNLGAGDWTVPF